MNSNDDQPMRFLVTKVLSSSSVEGSLISGILHLNDSIAVAPSGQQSSILRISHGGKQVDSITAPAELVIDLTYSVSMVDGNIIAPADNRPEFADQFEARLNWIGDVALLPGRAYALSAAGGSCDASISKLKYRIDATNNQHLAVNTLASGESGVANIGLTRPMIFDSYSVCVSTGEFQLSEKDSGVVVANGEIRHGLRRASNVHWQALDVDKESRAGIKNQTPKIIWLTGLSGSGKSTIANLIEKKLIATARHSYLLDGDNVRHGLNKDLGFTDADRVENIRRVGETAKLMLDAGLIVITSFISPFRAERDLARSLFDEGEFIEIFVDASLEICESRDPKGLYKKARNGEIKNFTGLDSPYEAPKNPEMIIDTGKLSIEEAADEILAYIETGTD